MGVQVSPIFASRKPYSSKLENLGQVRSLGGSVINGFTTLGSVILTPK